MEKDYEKLFTIKYLLKEPNFSRLLEAFKKDKPVFNFPNKEIGKLFEAIKREPKPLRKYRVDKEIFNDFKEGDIALKWNNEFYLKELCEKYDQEVGFVYTPLKANSNLQFLYYIDKNKIYINLSYGESTLSKETEKRFEKEYINNIFFYSKDDCGNIGSVIIDVNGYKKENFVNYSDINGLFGNYKNGNIKEYLYKGRLVISRKELQNSYKVLREYEEFLFDSKKINMVFYNNTSTEKNYFIMNDEFPETLKRVDFYKLFIVRENIALQYLYISFLTLLYLKFADTKKIETFESVILGKNKKTSFIDPETGMRNQGIIVVNRKVEGKI